MRNKISVIMLTVVVLMAISVSALGADMQKTQMSSNQTRITASQDMENKSLYDRLGGVFAIAAVVNRFSDEVVKNPIVGQNSSNPALKEWSTKDLDRLPGLKFMRTLWVVDVAGGPMKYTGTKPGQTQLGLEKAHWDLRISPEEFDEVAKELEKALDYYGVPEREKEEVLAAFAAHKGEVNAGYFAAKR